MTPFTSMRLLASICAVSACLAGNVPAPDASVVARIQTRVTENLAGLPDYTCTQTIERATRRSSRDSYRTADLVRLEVAYVGDKELFGYPGGEQLDETEITRLVPSGVVSSGDFAMLARDVFANPGATYTLIGQAKYKGRTAIRCDYAVPLSASHYRLRVTSREAVVPYHGDFWVDAATLDLLRFDVIADRIPLDLGLASSRLLIDYDQVSFGASQFLLPRSSELLVSSLNGWETRNQTSFAAYRRFQGESSISFDDDAAAAHQPVSAPRRMLRVKLPRDFSAALTLQTAIDSATAAIGDPVTFRLERDLRHGNTVAVPKHAIFTGRILRLEHLDGKFAVAFRLETVEFGQFRADLRSRRNVFSMNDYIRAGSWERGTLAFSSLTREDRGPGALITVLTDHLRWPKGFHFSLRSRMP